MREFWLNCEKCLLNFQNFDKANNEYRYRITKKIFRMLGKVAMSQTFLVFEVMNEKQTYIQINFKFISGP